MMGHIETFDLTGGNQAFKSVARMMGALMTVLILHTGPVAAPSSARVLIGGALWPSRPNAQVRA